MRRARHSIAVLLCMVGWPGLVMAGDAPSASSFVDHFTNLDPSRWMISDGWSNGDHQACTWSASNVKLGDGGVTLLLTDQPAGERKFSCAEIRTKGAYGYGTYEVRMRSAAGEGITSTFFTYVGPPFGAGLPHDEIDFEFLGKRRSSVQLNYYGNGKGKHEHIAKFDYDVTVTARDYAFEWAPDAIRWYADGALIHEVVQTPGAVLPSVPGRIFLSIWAGQGRGMDGWLGRFNYPGEPLSATYEWVAFTEAGAPCQFPSSIVCKLGNKKSAPK